MIQQSVILRHVWSEIENRILYPATDGSRRYDCWQDQIDILRSLGGTDGIDRLSEAMGIPRAMAFSRLAEVCSDGVGAAMVAYPLA